MDSARATVSDTVAPVLTVLHEPIAGVERWTTALPTLFTVYAENIRLKQENAELRKWQNVALSLEDRVQRFEALLHVPQGKATRQVTARVIGESNRSFVSTMILNAGEAEGVQKGQAVADDRGLIGRIYLTGEHTAWVILLTDLNSRVPVMIEPMHRRAILVGNNTGMPELELDVGEEAIAAGSRVVTTGDGGLLPPDLPIGTVMDDAGTLQVALLAAADTSDFVQVLDYGQAPRQPAAKPKDVIAISAVDTEAQQPVQQAKKEDRRDPAVARAALAQEVPAAAEGEDR